MRWTILTPAVSVAAVLALAVPASAGVSDFRLPQGSTRPQPEPDRQGPVAPDVPASRGPSPTPTPAARAPAPTPTPTASAPRTDLPARSERTVPARTTRTPAAAPSPTVAPSLPPAADLPAAETPVSGAAPELDVPTVASAPADAPAVPDEGSNWPWILGGLAALGLLGGAGFVFWRRRQAAGPRVPPVVERPSLAPDQVPVPRPAAPAVPAPIEPLQVTLEPLRLSLTLMNATLAYRLEVANRGLTPITALRVGADMIAAHASMSREEQLAGPGNSAPTVQRIERLEPGQSSIVEGEFRVPFSQIVPIRQGNAALLLPLARFRLEADGAKPMVRTFVVGQPGNGTNLQPFRLDLGPRIYPTLAQHAFA